MIPPSLRDAADDPALSVVAVRVFVWLYGRLELHEWRPVKAYAVARALRIRPQTAGDALTALVRYGYLLEGSRDGHIRQFRRVDHRRSAECV